MKYSYRWLQKHIEETLPSVSSLKDTIIFHAFEVESEEVVGDDTILDIKVLPDRAHDCLSHYGMARELAGLLGLTLKLYTYAPLPETALSLSVEIQSPLCRRYIAIKIDNVSIKASPQWLKEALESIGARSINNVVDATNYVLFDRGQPVHAFDTAKIDGGIVVRLAREGETITTLSKEEKVLKENDLVIADYLGALAIAGVKGGATGEVDEKTTSLVVEVANFEPVAVRKTSRRLGLVTDASKRFENDLTPEIALDCAMHVAHLIREIAGGDIVGVSDTYQTKPEQKTISFDLHEVQRILGASLTIEDIVSVFTRFRYTFTQSGEQFVLTVPFERIDLTGAHDVADEIGRVRGYEKVEALPLPFTPTVQVSEYDKVRAVKYFLSGQGFCEVMNYSLRKKGEVYLSYAPKDKSALRTNLSDGLKESYELNRLNAPLFGAQKVCLFEMGTVFSAEKEEVRVATVDAGVFEELALDEFIARHTIALDHVFEVSHVTGTFVPWSLYPHMVRDVAVWVADENTKEQFLQTASVFAQARCAREPFVFDTFTKDGRTSVAVRFVFQAKDRTMTDAEVSEIFDSFLEKIKTIGGVEVR